jgi:multidrug efflux pump subunit AcrA (membrane-fusion protein)
MGKKLLIILVILVLVVGIPVGQKVLGGGEAVAVIVEPLGLRSIQTSVLASGRLVHEEEINLSTEQPGRVTAIHVSEGVKVSRGQLLLEIDDERYRTTVDQRQAAVRMQEIAIDRQRTALENQRVQWNRMAELSAVP